MLIRNNRRRPAEVPGRAWTPAAAPVVAYVLAAAAYLATAARQAYLGDWGDFLSSAAVLGVAHPTGYPTYVQVLNLVTLAFPAAWAAAAANLAQALVVAAVAPLGYFLLQELFELRSTRAQALAAVGTVALALAPVLWREASSAEVYGPALALLLLSFLVAARYLKNGGASPLVLMFFLAGLTLTQHLTYGLFVLVVAAVAAVRKAKPGPLLYLAVAAGALAFSSVLYLPLRTVAGSPLSWAGIGDLRGFGSHVTGRQFGYHLFAPTAAIFTLRVKELAAALWDNMGPFALLAPVGVWRVWVKNRRLATVAGAFIFVCVYDVMDLESFYLYPVFATGWAALAAVVWLAGEFNKTRVISYVVAAALGAGAVTQFVLHNGAENKNDPFLREYPRFLLKPIGFEGLYVASEIETNFPFWYQRYGLSHRPDIEFYNTNDKRRTPTELYATVLANRDRKAALGDYGFLLAMSGGRAADNGYPAGFILSASPARAGERPGDATVDGEALRLCRSLLRARPVATFGFARGQREALKALAHHGFYYMARGDAARARAFFEEAASFAPEAAETHLSYAEFLIHTGDYEAAIAEARAAAALSPGAVSAYLLASRAYAAEGDGAAALAEAEKAVAYGPAEGPAFANLASAYLAMDRRAEAVAAFEKALALGSYEVPTVLALAQLYRENGEPERAVAALAEAVEENPAPVLLRAYGEVLAECGRDAEAAAAFERAGRPGGR